MPADRRSVSCYESEKMTLDRYLFRQFLPIFIVAMILFVFLLLLIDLFANLYRFLNNEVPFLTVIKISIFFIPKSISYALPISLLFAAAYTLGDLYSKNELTSIFSSGIPLWRFSAVLLAVGFIVSIFSFFLDDIFVIPSLKIKNDLSRRALGQYVSENNSDIVIKAKNGKLVYSVDYYDTEKQILNGVSIIDVDEKENYIQIRAPSAVWNETYWEFNNAVIYQYENGILRIKPLGENRRYSEHPDTFRRSALIVDELKTRDVGLLVKDLRSLGLPYYQAQANYHHRFSFSATSFIVMMLSISMSGRFRKNVLLMSLFTSLSVAVVYYIAEMLSMTMAGLNYFPPVIGAWFPIFLFIVIGIYLLRSAKT
jgi:lipopolysaccharide export system permease protein